MRLPDEIFLLKKSAEAGIVTNGLVWNIDGSDEFGFGSTSKSPLIYERVSEDYLTSVYNSNSTFEDYDDYYKLKHGGSTANRFTFFGSGSIYNSVKTVDFVLKKIQGGSLRILSTYNGQSANRYFAYIIALPGKVSLTNGTSTTVFNVDSVPPEDVHVAIVFDDTARVFVNGVATDSKINVNLTTNITYAFTHYTNSTGQYHDLCALRMYDRALTDAEVLQNYNYEKSIGRA